MSGAPGFGKTPSADQLLVTAKWAFVAVEVDVACNKYLVSYKIDDIRCQAAHHHRTVPMPADKSELRPHRTAATGRIKWQLKLHSPFALQCPYSAAGCDRCCFCVS